MKRTMIVLPLVAMLLAVGCGTATSQSLSTTPQSQGDVQVDAQPDTQTDAQSDGPALEPGGDLSRGPRPGMPEGVSAPPGGARPGGALPEGEVPAATEGQDINATVARTISTSGEHVISGTIDGQVLVTAADVTLVLDGVDINCTDGTAILSEDGELIVELRGENKVSGSAHGIQGKDNLVITGSGTVNITAGKDGLHGGDELRVEGGNVNVAQSNEGMEAPAIIISGGSSTIFSADDGINAAVDAGDTAIPSILITGGEVTIYAGSDGIDSNGTVDITGGTVAILVNAPQDGDLIDADSQSAITQPMLWVMSAVAAGTDIQVNGWGMATQADATAVGLIMPGITDGESYQVMANGTELATVAAATALQGQRGGGPGMRGGGRGGWRP